MGAVATAPFVKAFFRDARDPFRFARKPEDELIDVPGPPSEDDEPLLNLPSLATSGAVGVGMPTE